MNKKVVRNQRIGNAPKTLSRRRRRALLARVAEGDLASLLGPGRPPGGVVSEADLVQETRARLLTPEACAGFDPAKGDAEGFAGGVARNVCREASRSEGRHQRLRREYVSPVAKGPDPVAEAIRSEELERVREALRSFQPGDADLIVRRFGLGPETGAALTPREQCRLCRALKRLRGFLAE